MRGSLLFKIHTAGRKYEIFRYTKFCCTCTSHRASLLLLTSCFSLLSPVSSFPFSLLPFLFLFSELFSSTAFCPLGICDIVSTRITQATIYFTISSRRERGFSSDSSGSRHVSRFGSSSAFSVSPAPPPLPAFSVLSSSFRFTFSPYHQEYLRNAPDDAPLKIEKRVPLLSSFLLVQSSTVQTGSPLCSFFASRRPMNLSLSSLRSLRFPLFKDKARRGPTRKKIRVVRDNVNVCNEALSSCS